MENFDNFGEFPIVLGVNEVRFPKKFTHVIFTPKRNTKKKVGMIGQCRGNSLTLMRVGKIGTAEWLILKIHYSITPLSVEYLHVAKYKSDIQMYKRSP